MSDSWDFSSVETHKSRSRDVVDQDMHLRINRVVDDLVEEGVHLALQELQRRSPPPCSSGESSAISFGSAWDSTQSSSVDSPRSPFAKGRFAEPFPPQQSMSASAGSSLRGSSSGPFLAVPPSHQNRGMRRSNSEVRPGPTGTL